MRVGVLGGSFDPVHFGHLHLAISLAEAHHLDEVWWIPVRMNPLKTESVQSPVHRLEMLKLGLQGIPYFKALDLELKREGLSYTIDTLRRLKTQYPKIIWHLLMGDDLLEQFGKWKDPEEIIRLAPPLIGARLLKNFPSHLPYAKEIMIALQKGWTPIPFIEISATEIRKRLKENKFCGHLVPAKVLDYIANHRLY